MEPRIAIVGAGAVGGYVGANLAQAGHDVTLIDPWPDHVEAIRANGMNLYGMTEAERRTVRVPAMHLTEVQALAKQRPIDIAFISVKSYDTIWATPDDPPVSRTRRLRGVDAELHQRGARRLGGRLGPHAGRASSAAAWASICTNPAISAAAIPSGPTSSRSMSASRTGGSPGARKRSPRS